MAKIKWFLELTLSLIYSDSEIDAAQKFATPSNYSIFLKNREDNRRRANKNKSGA
jgi:hypothetical protein